MNDKSLRPFGVKDQIGYVFGDMAGSFVNLFVDAYFLTFCTYVLGISPGTVFSRPTLGRHQRPDHGFFPRPLETWQKRRQVQTMDKTVYDSSGPFRYFMFCQRSI